MPVLEAPARVDTNTHDKFHKLVAAAQKHPPVKVAVAHPCDRVSLESVVEAAKLKLIEPILVGPEQRIRDVASKNGIDISHFFVMDVPGHDQPLIITDAAVNIAPDLKAKVDIVQNAIDLAHALTPNEVRVAILSAMESVNPDVPSTL